MKLSLGRASRSAATPAAEADLVIDFEILPPRKATAESIQLFFDRALGCEKLTILLMTKTAIYIYIQYCQVSCCWFIKIVNPSLKFAFFVAKKWPFFVIFSEASRQS